MIEAIEKLNKRLDDHFGHDDLGRAIWKIVWSDDQKEKRQTMYTKEGLELLYPVVIELPKYPYIKEKWILERLVLVPEFQRPELADVMISYEPMWTFEDKHGRALYPKWEAVRTIIDCVYLAIGKYNAFVKYKDPDSGKTTKQIVEEKRERIKQIQEDLFGNENDITDALASKAGVSVPHNYGEKQ